MTPSLPPHVHLICAPHKIYGLYRAAHASYNISAFVMSAVFLAADRAGISFDNSENEE